MNKNKTPINLIYSSDLCIKLMEQPRLITTKQNIFLKMVRPMMMTAHISLNADEQKGYTAKLVTDETGLDNFIAEHQITDLIKLDGIEEGLLWIKYLAGKAEVRFELSDMEARICFRVVDGCTMAYSYDLHFCDRIPQVLSMLKSFEGYLVLNKSRLLNRSLESRDDKGHLDDDAY